MVRRGAFVGDVGGLTEHEEPVTEARRNPELTSVARLERHADPFSKTRRRAPQIHRDIEDDPAHRANELALRVLELKVEAA